jgi:hypothetical protein
VKHETAEQLDAFRRQQEEDERQAKLQENKPIEMDENQDWAVASKKRKKPEQGGLKGIKLRKTSSSEPKKVESSDREGAGPSLTKLKHVEKTGAGNDESSASNKAEAEPAKVPPKSSGLGLVAYSSDSDD